jgi:hypothetical protein
MLRVSDDGPDELPAHTGAVVRKPLHFLPQSTAHPAHCGRQLTTQLDKCQAVFDTNAGGHAQCVSLDFSAAAP